MNPALRGVRLAATVARVRLRRTGPPRLLTYTVSFACNARCIMCDSWRKDSSGDLSARDVDAIFAQLPPMDAVRLTGGEPFVRRDLVAIAAGAAERLKPALLHVTTNGFLTDRIVDFCERRPRGVPLHLLVSIDGLAARHDEIRGHPGALRSALRTLEALAPRRKELGLRIAVNQTIVDPQGITDYRALRDLLAPLGIRNQVVIAYRESATYAVCDESEVAPRYPGAYETFGTFSGAQLRELFGALNEGAGSYPFAERAAKRYYNAGIRSRLLNGEARPNPPCVALNAHLRIFPNGDVPVCQFNSRRVGNLRAQRFGDLWESAQAQQARAWVRACPGCWAECEVLPNAVYSGDLACRMALRGGNA